MKLLKIKMLFMICMLLNYSYSMKQQDLQELNELLERKQFLSERLIKAIDNGDIEKIEKLLEKQASPFIPTKGQITPFMRVQLYIPKDNTKLPREKMLEFFNKKFPIWADTIEFTIESDDESDCDESDSGKSSGEL